MNIREVKLRALSENDKIMYVIEKVLGAVTEDTAVCLEQVIEKGIELGITEDYPRGKEDGHPWWPRVSLMMGVGSRYAVDANEEFNLHRVKMVKERMPGQRTKASFFYWVDRRRRHESVSRKSKANGSRTFISQYGMKKTEYTESEKNEKVTASPDKFRLVKGKLLSVEWIEKNPEKFRMLYGDGQ